MVCMWLERCRDGNLKSIVVPRLVTFSFKKMFLL